MPAGHGKESAGQERALDETEHEAADEQAGEVAREILARDTRPQAAVTRPTYKDGLTLVMKTLGGVEL